MKNVILLTLITLCACSSDEGDRCISQKLTKGEVWEYKLGNPSVQGGYSIKTDARHVEISELLKFIQTECLRNNKKLNESNCLAEMIFLRSVKIVVFGSTHTLKTKKEPTNPS